MIRISDKGGEGGVGRAPSYLGYELAESFLPQPCRAPGLSQQGQARVALRQDEGGAAEGHHQEASTALQGDVEALGGVLHKLL